MGRAFLWGAAFGLAAGALAGIGILVGQALGGILLDGPYRDTEAP